MKKDLRNIKDSLLKGRARQAGKRSVEVDETQVINPDQVNDVYEGLYSKGMPHDSTTMLASDSSIKELQIALKSGKQEDFDDIPQAGARKQVSPQGALSIELSGADPEGLSFRESPSLDSREALGEMVEVYHKALLREVAFDDYQALSAEVQLAIDELNFFGSDFKGPKVGGLVTRKTLFRGVAPGCIDGPMVSQLLYHPINFGNTSYEQKGTRDTGLYGITKANYLSIQDGNVPVPQTNDGIGKFIHDGRQGGSYVHSDFVYQAFYNSAALLVGKVSFNSAFGSRAKEAGFVTGGGPVGLSTAVAEVSRHALKAAWVQKWRKQLRLRPEAMAARIVAIEDGDLASSLIDNSLAAISAPGKTIEAVKNFNLANGGEQKAFLPLMYAEGSPTHPSYPAGHAAIAGACATILKIYLAEGPWSGTGLTPMTSVDGTTLVDYATSAEGTADGDAGSLTVHGELNKAAANMSIFRNIAGVHYRIDGDEGMNLGEKVAIQYFKDLRDMQNEEIGSITIVKFDGTTEVI